jgi:hypothetical protein
MGPTTAERAQYSCLWQMLAIDPREEDFSFGLMEFNRESRIGSVS